MMWGDNVGLVEATPSEDPVKRQSRPQLPVAAAARLCNRPADPHT